MRNYRNYRDSGFGGFRLSISFFIFGATCDSLGNKKRSTKLALARCECCCSCSWDLTASRLCPLIIIYFILFFFSIFFGFFLLVFYLFCTWWRCCWCDVLSQDNNVALSEAACSDLYLQPSSEARQGNARRGDSSTRFLVPHWP